MPPRGAPLVLIRDTRYPSSSCGPNLPVRAPAVSVRAPTPVYRRSPQQGVGSKFVGMVVVVTAGAVVAGVLPPVEYVVGGTVDVVVVVAAVP